MIAGEPLGRSRNGRPVAADADHPLRRGRIADAAAQIGVSP
jgi:hypothetical protein